ncbi:hypothetical protein V8E53_001515 [Lactarius tabidus]
MEHRDIHDPFPCDVCAKECTSIPRLAQHKKSKHPDIVPPKTFMSHTRFFHPKLNAQPCQEDGTFLQELPVTPTPGEDDQPVHDWTPFEDRLAFDWVNYHYMSLQSSAAEITQGLNLWSAMAFKYGSSTGTPWKTAKDMYEPIDAIQTGSLPFKTHRLFYEGLKPSTPPHWMEEAYELDAYQLAMSGFKDQFDYVPYKEFNNKGERIWSNLMSAQWAFKQVTTVSTATGHQEYHPVYVSVGNLSNTARRARGNGVLPAAFLPIPKASQTQQKHPEFQHFCRQSYHCCLELIFEPLQKYMMTYTAVKCADGLFCHAIFGLGPYIADYPEQVWLGGVVYKWCAKCESLPKNMVTGVGRRRTHKKTDYLVKKFDPRIVWDAFGIYEDVMPFTHNFPHTDIHELLAPDLLHQVIKGIFKDHLILWVGLYLEHIHSKTRAHDIMGLQQFPDGRDFTQWTGNDSKVLMKVYLGAISGYLPLALVCCISTFMDACYIARWNAISASALEHFRECVERFHKLCDAFIACGIREEMSLPCQHAFNHYYHLIIAFGSPNGLCSSITESKHIKAVKDTWHRSSRFKAIAQIVVTLLQLHKMAAACQHFTLLGMLKGTATTYVVGVMDGDEPQEDLMLHGSGHSFPGADEEGVPVDSVRDEESLSLMTLYLAASVQQPGLPLTLWKFLFLSRNPDSISTPSSLSDLPSFHGHINVHYSALATFFAPSDLCGVGGMHQEQICSAPSWYDCPHHDTVFVILDDTLPGMEGMVIAHVQLLFLFDYSGVDQHCALVNWLVCKGDEPDPDTRMWIVSLEKRNREPTTQVIDVKTMVRTAHLLPVFGQDMVPSDVHHYNSLDRYQSFFVNKYADHHSHKLLTDHYQ